MLIQMGSRDHSCGDYLQLLDWPDRQIRCDKRGAMPANRKPEHQGREKVGPAGSQPARKT